MKPSSSRDQQFFAILPWILMQGIVCALLLITWGGRDKTAYGQESPNRYILVLVDESDTIRGNEDFDLEANDPDNRRTRFTRFLVQYLQAFEQDTEVGVIGFVAQPVTVTHLMPVEQWSRADLQSLERLLTQSAEQKGHTSFKPALQAAQNSLRTHCNENSDDQCQIVLFTDGLWETDLTRETGAVISSTLQALRQEGVSVVVVLLAGDPIPARYATGDYLRIWEAGSTVVISNATEMSAQTVYQGVLQGLGLDEGLNRPPTWEFSRTIDIVEPVLPFQRYTRIIFLADNPVAETWMPAPDVQIGVDRLWLDPPEGEIRGRLEVIGERPQTTLVYYRVLSETYPIGFEARIMPDCVALGQATILDGWFTAGGQTIAGGAGFSIQATVDDASGPLTQQPDGHFTRVLTPTLPGEHRVVFQPTIPEFVQADEIGDLNQTFYAETLPRLRLSVETPEQVPTSTIPLTITVTIENAASSRDALTPTVMLVEQQKQKPLSLRSEGTGEFVTVTEVTSGTRYVVRAHLARGQTKQGLYFGDQEDEQPIPVPGPYRVLEPPPNLSQVIHLILERFPVLLAPGLFLLLLLCMAIAVAVGFWWKEKARQKRELNKAKQEVAQLAREAQKGRVGPEALKKMSTAVQTMGKAHPQLDSMKDEIQECGRLVSLAYRVEIGGVNENTEKSEYASGVKEDLVQQAKNDSNIVALAMLLHGLLDACFPKPSEQGKRLLPLNALYSHIFSFNSDLATIMLDGNSDAGSPRISKRFVEAFEFVVPLAPLAPDQESHSVRKIWEAFCGLVRCLSEWQSLNKSPGEDATGHLQKISGETGVEKEGLAKFLETVSEASGGNCQDFKYLSRVFGALQNLARDVANQNSFQDYENLETAMRRWEPNCVPEACAKEDLEKTFEQLAKNSVQDFSYLQLKWSTGRDGHGEYKFPNDQAFSKLGMGIPEFLILGQIQRFTK